MQQNKEYRYEYNLRKNDEFNYLTFLDFKKLWY